MKICNKFLNAEQEQTIKMRREAEKYFIYTRKSEEFEDRQTQSLDDQIRTCKEIALRDNRKIVGIFQESKSARKPNKRPVFAKMVQKIENDEADGILCWKTNRLARNLKEGGYLFDLLQQGIIKHIKTSETDWYEDADALLFSVELGLSSKYSDDVSKDVLRGMQYKRDHGEFPHMAGKGYINKDGKIVPDTEDNRFGILKECWKMLLYENNSISQIRNKVNFEWGFETRKTKRNGGKKLTNARLYEMFSNPFYKGEYTFRGKTYKLNHMPMITSEEWNLAQITLGRKNRPRRKSHEFAYRGPLTCGFCGCLVTAEVKTKPIKSTREIKVYPPYYHCTGRKGNCSQNKKYIREDKLEQLIKDEISRFTILPQFRDWALEVLRESHADEVSERKILFKNLEKSYKEAENKINNLIDMRASDEITKVEFDRKKEEYAAEKARIKENIDNYDHRVDQWFELTERAFDFISCARDAFENGDLDTKKAILTALGQKIILLDGKIHIEPEEWLVPIADRYPALEREYKMFEPAKNTDFTHKNEILAPVRTAWLGREDSNHN